MATLSWHENVFVRIRGYSAASDGCKLPARADAIMPGEPNAAYLFEPFRLVVGERALFERDRPVRLGGRAFDLLVALVENAGSLVTTRALMTKVWHGTIVEEVNLRVHIASLRKALGDGRHGRRFITTSVGNGYAFVAPVVRAQLEGRRPPSGTERSGGALPPAPRMIGREQLEDGIAEAVSRRRLVTLVGPGGIGKTSVALAVAHRLAPRHADGALFVDLATVARDEHLFSAFATALGTRAVASAADLGSLVGDHDVLILLDNCEHLIDAVADVVGELLRRAPKLHVVATSREALRAEDEWVYRIPSLEVPSQETRRATEALAYSSVALFVERASTGAEPYELTDADVPWVSKICRRLDGIPLAIELAASRVEALGIAALSTALHAHLSATLRGPRSATPRQRTLRATFEWSYATLSPSEQRTLRALSAFRGPFTFDGAAAVASASEAEHALVYEEVTSLVEKSMASADPRDDEVRFRLLEVTREYAGEQLRASGESETVSRRHATYHRRVCEAAEGQLTTRPAADWITAHRWRIDDVRAALSWAFGSAGDTAVGVAITVASSALWFEVCSLEEYRQYVERALAYVWGDRSPKAEEAVVKLRLALGIMILHTIGPVPAMTEAIAGGLSVAEKLSPALHMQAVGAMWVDGIARADYHAVLATAERFAALANSVDEPAALVVADRLTAYARHFHGRLEEGRRHAERVLATPTQRLVYSTPLQVDGRVTMRTLLARTLWLQGFPEMAAEEARRCVDFATALGHVGALCFILALGACPVAFWSGDVDEAERYVSLLIETASRASFGYWVAWGRAYDHASKLRSGHGLRAADLGIGAKQRDHLVTVRADLLDDITQARAEAGDVGWCVAEVRRAQAARARAAGSTSEAARLLREALRLARGQGALGWELRIAIDLARLAIERGNALEGRRLLTETTSRFTEGSRTADRRAAQALLVTLGA
jgi:predicted ATPase/DNA-binding winged helix-turn-helix (wHTH) protein